MRIQQRDYECEFTCTAPDGSRHTVTATQRCDGAWVLRSKVYPSFGEVYGAAIQAFGAACGLSWEDVVSERP